MNITERLTPINHDAGRGGAAVEAVVVHISDGDGSPVGWFHDPTSGVSSNYVVERDGAIIRVVAEHDTAWCNGWRFDRPGWRDYYRPNMGLAVVASWAARQINPNRVTVSIECTGRPAGDLTPAQLGALAWLVADLCRRYRLEPARHVISHADLDSVNRARCPSLTAGEWARVRGLVAEYRELGYPVGEGVRAVMAAVGDRAAGGERYYGDGDGEYSLTAGVNALYIWTRAGGKVAVLPWA